MYKSWKWLNCLLYIVPFVNICNNRGHGALITALMFVFIFLFYISTTRRNKLSSGEYRVKIYGMILSLCVIFMIIISYLNGIDNFSSIRFFCLFPFFILVFIRTPLMNKYIEICFIKYLSYLVVIISLSIVVDYILMRVGLLTMQPMYSEEQFAYTTRPFGIFGQPSVNSSLLCLFYILRLRLLRYMRIKQRRDLLFIFVTIGCVVQGSGSGFISYAIALLCKFGASNKIKISFKRFIPSLIIAVIVLIAIIMSNKVHKLSINYIIVLLEYTRDELWLPYLHLMTSPLQLWFGVNNFPLSIDFGPLYLIGTVGLLYFLVVTVFCVSLYFKSRSTEMKLLVILLLVGNLHYPVMFYFIMNVIWFFICYIILVLEYEKK